MPDSDDVLEGREVEVGHALEDPVPQVGVVDRLADAVAVHVDGVADGDAEAALAAELEVGGARADAVVLERSPDLERLCDYLQRSLQTDSYSC